jgi:hypothetical protein
LGKDWKVVFDAGKTEMNEENAGFHMEAIQFLFLIIKKFMLVPKFCEKIDCVVDLAGHGMKGCRIVSFGLEK